MTQQQPAATQIWAELAEEYGGSFTQSEHSKPSLMRIAVPGTIRYKFEDWEIVLDAVVTQGSNNQTPRPTTRLRSLFSSRDDLRFKIYREIDSLFMSALKFLHLIKDIEIGDPDFDAQFIIRGSDEYKIGRLFSDKHMQTMLNPMPENSVFQILDQDPNIFKRNLPHGVDILQWSYRGVCDDPQLLRAMCELFHYTLSQLVVLDSASSMGPKETLKD